MRTVFSRRVFLSSTTAALANAVSIAAPPRQVCIGIAGLGSRGAASLWGFVRTKGVHVGALCEPNRKRLERAAAVLWREQKTPAELSADYRALLDRPDLDAIAIALPSQLSLDAARKTCQSHKHVFLAPEGLLGLQESKRIEAAAAKHGALVEVFSPIAEDETEMRQAFQSLFQVQRQEIDASISGVSLDDSLSQDTLGVLDLCRRDLGAGLPSQVAVMECPGRSLAVSFVFEDQEGAPVRLRWETLGGQSFAGVRRVSIAGSFAGRTDSLELVLPVALGAHGHGSVEAFQRFARAIRIGDSSLLDCPISEVRRTHGLIRLARVARTAGGPVRFDPRCERLVHGCESWQAWLG